MRAQAWAFLLVGLVGGLVVATEDSPLQAGMMRAEMAALRTAQDTVKRAQSDLDEMDQNQSEEAMLKKTKADKAEAKRVAEDPMSGPDLGEALMADDDKQPTAELGESASSANAQVQAVNDDMHEQANDDGRDHADKKDIKKVFDLAKSMNPGDLLPEGWEEKVDGHSGRAYYENKETHETTWDPPKSLVGIAMTAAQGQMQMKKELSAMKEKMERMSRESDLGESASVNSRAACDIRHAKRLGEAMKVATELRTTVVNMAEKLNLTGEQQGLLKKLLAQHKLPSLTTAEKKKIANASKQTISVLAAKKKAHKKKGTKHSKKDPEHNDLGESGDVGESDDDAKIVDNMPAELREAKALEESDDKIASERVAAAMKAESARVAKDFLDDQREKETVVRKAAMDAAAAVDKKMESEDAALLASDKDTNLRMEDIVGDQKQLENEQALFRGTMTPDQVNQVVDPDIAEMEKSDLAAEGDNDFKPVELN